MGKIVAEFGVVVKDRVVKEIGKSVVYVPKTKKTEGSIKWFDDTKLLKTSKI